MSDFRIDKITNRDGNAGTQICGVTTFSGTSGMVMPGGPTEHRGGRDRGIHGGGNTNPANVNVIDYITIAAKGDAIDFGDLTIARSQISACGGYTRGHFNGGSPDTTRMDYVVFSSKGGASEWGDLTQGRSTYAATSNGKRGLVYGGTPSNNNLIEYFSMATQGGAADFGDQIYNQREQGCLENSTRSVVAGGWGDPTAPFQGNSGPIKFISYNYFETLGNTVHFGELNNLVYGPMGSASETRGLFAGGWTPSTPVAQINVIDYITIATEGDATDFGDTTAIRHSGGGTSNKVRGIWSGGYNPGLLATIDYVQIATLGNAADFGDLTVARRGGRMCSDCHGGLE